jgi:hypothetical protein
LIGTGTSESGSGGAISVSVGSSKTGHGGSVSVDAGSTSSVDGTGGSRSSNRSHLTKVLISTTVTTIRSSLTTSENDYVDHNIETNTRRYCHTFL